MKFVTPNSAGREEIDAAFLEANDCHNPAGSPAGGQFCSGPGKRSTYFDRLTNNDPAAIKNRTQLGPPTFDPSKSLASRASQYGGKAKTLPEPDLSWTHAVRQNFEDKKWAGDQKAADVVGGWGRLAELRKTGKKIRSEDLPVLRQAAEDWKSGRASRSRTGKGWRIRTERSEFPTSRYGGRARVPTWSKVVNRYFKDAMEFHRFANAS